MIYESPVFKTSFVPEGYIQTVVKSGSEISLADAEKNTEAVVELSKGSNYPILVDLREIKSISKEARDHFSMRGRKPHVTAISMLVNSPVSKIVGNFFLGLNKPTVPTRLFTSQKEAINWVLKIAQR